MHRYMLCTARYVAVATLAGCSIAIFCPLNPASWKRLQPCLCYGACRFVTTLELAVRFGKTLIVEDADSLLPLMQPLISGDLQGHGSNTTVRIGDRTIDHNKDFKLILTTLNSSPQLLLDAEAYLSVANFTVTR